MRTLWLRCANDCGSNVAKVRFTGHGVGYGGLQVTAAGGSNLVPDNQAADEHAERVRRSPVLARASASMAALAKTIDATGWTYTWTCRCGRTDRRTHYWVFWLWHHLLDDPADSVRWDLSKPLPGQTG